MDEIGKLKVALNAVVRQRDEAMNAIINLHVTMEELQEEIRKLKEKPSENAAPTEG